MTMFVVPRDRPHSRPEFRPHRREGGEQHVRESRSEPDSLGGVSLLVNGAAPELPTPVSMAYWTIGMYGAGKRDCRWRCVSEYIKELQTVRCVGCSWVLGFLSPLGSGLGLGWVEA